MISGILLGILICVVLCFIIGCVQSDDSLLSFGVLGVVGLVLLAAGYGIHQYFTNYPLF